MTIDNSVALTITEDELEVYLVIADEQSVSEELVNRLLKQEGVNYGVDRDLLTEIFKNPRKGTFLIASGKPPREGRDGYTEFKFTTRASLAKEEDESRVDFREVFNIPSVNADTVLAVYYPAVKGEDGITVTGRVIPAGKVAEYTLKAGKGAALSADGRSVTSTANGRPWALKRGKNIIIGVDVIYWHQGDVDIKSGNLRLFGDVVITGNVTENMIVDVTGNLKVAGFISRAGLNIGKSLEAVKVITASKVNAGGVMASYGGLVNQLREIEKTINSLDTVTAQVMDKLRQSNKNLQVGQIIMALMEKKFTGLGAQVQKFGNDFKKLKQKPPAELVEAAEALSFLHGLKVLSIKNLDDIKNSIARAITFFDRLNKEPAHITAHSFWNSEVEATGNIIITGQGAFNSRLSALGAIDVKGVVRGGEVYAKRGIRAGEIGGAMGVKTLVRTDEGQIIRARRLFNGSVLQIGSRTYTAHKDLDTVMARLNQQGNIVLY